VIEGGDFLDFGQAIKVARKNAGMTQGELAEKIGCTTNTICDWEREKYPPTNANNIAALETALNFESAVVKRKRTLFFDSPHAA